MKTRTGLALFSLTAAILFSASFLVAQEGRFTGVSYCAVPGHGQYNGLYCPKCADNSGAGNAGTLSPELSAAAGELGAVLGSALNKALFGDPVEQARRLAQRQQEQARLAEAARLRHIEELRQRAESFKRLAGILKLSDVTGLGRTGFDGEHGGALVFKGVDLKQPAPTNQGNPLGLKLAASTSNDVGLRPRGTAAFGIGGGPQTPLPPAPNTDPMVVDLRDLQQSAYVVNSIATAAPENTPLLIDEALKAANGDHSFVAGIPTDAVLPAIDGPGFLAFQEANRDYRKATDFRLWVTEKFNQASQQRELADRLASAAMVDLEQARLARRNETDIQKRQKLMADIFAAVRAVDEAKAKAQAEVQAAQLRSYRAREEAVRVLRATAAGKPPGDFHPPIASLPGLDDTTWMHSRERLIAFRDDLDRRNAQVQDQIKLQNLSTPDTWVRMHEGVILGAGTTSKDAAAMYSVMSPLSGKTPDEMNAASQRAKENGIGGVGGAVVVSFGTPKDDPLYLETESKRVIGDHLSIGQTSLNTTEGREAIAALSGREFDRLIAHSNGAPITEALIARDIIKVNELNIVGGDRSLLNGHAYQKLLDTGKVKRVVVWLNLNDPILTTAIDQLDVGQRGAHAVEHIVRKINGELTGGDSRVEYHFMMSAEQGVIASHYLATGYYPNMASEVGTRYAFNRENLAK